MKDREMGCTYIQCHLVIFYHPAQSPGPCIAWLVTGKMPSLWNFRVQSCRLHFHHPLLLPLASAALSLLTTIFLSFLLLFSRATFSGSVTLSIRLFVRLSSLLFLTCRPTSVHARTYSTSPTCFCTVCRTSTAEAVSAANAVWKSSDAFRGSKMDGSVR